MNWLLHQRSGLFPGSKRTREVLCYVHRHECVFYSWEIDHKQHTRTQIESNFSNFPEVFVWKIKMYLLVFSEYYCHSSSCKKLEIKIRHYRGGFILRFNYTVI